MSFNNTENTGSQYLIPQNNSNDTLSDVLAKLNEEQLKAATYTDGPSLVIAGAGSGKTRVLTSKIAYLLERGVLPWNILALTFTNKAAKEMKERIAALIGTEQASRVWMGTFHSLFARILRTESERIGYTSRFTIYDQSDSQSLVRSIVKEKGLNDKIYKTGLVLGRISAAKNRLITASDYQTDPAFYQRDATDNVPQIGQIYQLYEERCFQANAMDFDDLLVNTFFLLKKNPEVCQEYSQRFEHILVDEYQDTNYAQHRIITLLADNRKDLCVVGDDAQSIYSFRGADIDNILNFTKTYPSAQLFKLEQNYRSTQNIVSAANSVIKHNRFQIPKEVFSENSKGERIKKIEAYSDIEEAEIIAKEMNRLCSQKDLDYNRMAVLYRTNAQSRIFEETFRKHSIPYKLVGGLSFYQRKEIKDVMAYFRLTINPHDGEAFKRIVNYPARGIGATTLQKLITAANDEKKSLWDVLKSIDDESGNIKIQKSTRTKLLKFRSLIENFQKKQMEEDAYLLAQRIIHESGIFTEINQDNSPENISKRDNLMELMNAIQIFIDEQKEQQGNDFVSIDTYLSQASLMSDLEDVQEQDEESPNRVTLMTVHAAKGLEFDCVFTVGLEQDLFPSAMASYSIREMEEERRLFYVALTRAKRFCYISYAKSRYKYGSMTFSRPSPFLQDIDSQYLQDFLPDGANKYRFQSTVKPSSSFSDKSALTGNGTSTERLKRLSSLGVQEAASNSRTLTNLRLNTGETLSIGQRVEHQRFGYGKVLKIELSDNSPKATILFENSGEKNLLLQYAKLRIID